MNPVSDVFCQPNVICVCWRANSRLLCGDEVTNEHDSAVNINQVVREKNGKKVQYASSYLYLSPCSHRCQCTLLKCIPDVLNYLLGANICSGT